MDGLLLLAAFLLMVAGSVLFYRRSEHGRLKPRVLTWYGWAMVNAVAAIAIYSDGHYPAAMIASLLTLTGVIVGFWTARGKGTQFRQIDAVAQIAVLASIVLWVFFNSPIIAVIACIVIDLIVAVPAIRHFTATGAKRLLLPLGCWAIGAGCASLASDAWAVTAVAFPIYTAVLNTFAVLVIALAKGHDTGGDEHFSEVEEL